MHHLQELSLDAVTTVMSDTGSGQREIDIKKYVKIEKLPGGAIEDCRYVQAHVVMCRAACYDATIESLGKGVAATGVAVWLQGIEWGHVPERCGCARSHAAQDPQAPHLAAGLPSRVQEGRESD